MPVSKRVRLSSKGQLVVPQEMRKRLGLKPGDELVLHQVSDRILLAEVMEPSPLQLALAELEKEAQARNLTREQVERVVAEVRQETYRERQA